MHKIFEIPVVIESKNYVNDLFIPINDNLFFHKFEHSLEVAYRAVELGMREGLGIEKLEILAISGIFHDSGFSIQYDNNEIIGAGIAKIFLENFGYNKEKIKIIKNIIIATTLEKEPNNILEEIIKDADLDNLGRDDFFEKAQDIKKEIEKNKNIILEEKDWYTNVLKLTYKQKFYTKTENKERLLKKIKNVEQLKEFLNEI